MGPYLIIPFVQKLIFFILFERCFERKIISWSWCGRCFELSCFVRCNKSFNKFFNQLLLAVFVKSLLLSNFNVYFVNKFLEVITLSW